MVNVGKAIDAALTKVTGKYPRSKFVAWFNEIGGDILMQPRTWALFQGTEIPLSQMWEDNQDTLFPDEFFDLFVTGMRMHFYDIEKDGRYGKENSLYQIAMSNMKAQDNRFKPMLLPSRHGYIKGGDEEVINRRIEVQTIYQTDPLVDTLELTAPSPITVYELPTTGLFFSATKVDANDNVLRLTGVNGMTVNGAAYLDLMMQGEKVLLYLFNGNWARVA